MPGSSIYKAPVLYFASSHLVLTTISKYYFYSHFTHKAAETVNPF